MSVLIGDVGSKVAFGIGRFFFDREKVIEAVGKTEAKFLGYASNYTKKTAKNSIKTKRKTKKEMSRRAEERYQSAVLQWKAAGSPKGQKPKRPITDQASPPGSPPFSKTGLLKDHIYAALDTAKRASVIGPARLSGVTGDVPSALEHGGEVFSYRFQDMVRIRPRPYMQPALEASAPKFPEFFKKAIG